MYHAASNGQAERAVRVFKEGIVKMEGGSLKTKLSRFLLKYRITPHSITGVSPAELLMNRQLHTQLNLLRPNLSDRVLGKQMQQKAVHDYHAKDRAIQVDDAVYVKDFRQSKSWIPGTIVEKTGPVSAKVQLSSGEVIRRHQDLIRTRTDPDPAPQTDGNNQEIGLGESVLPASDGPPITASQIAVSQESASQRSAVNEAASPLLTSSTSKRRSTRNSQKPERFGDNICDSDS